MTVMRLQKYLSQAGIASRRASEQLIADGRVTVNGSTVTTPGEKVDTTNDQITFDGNPVKPTSNIKTVIFYKPRGYICSASETQGKTIFEFFKDIELRLYPVGRLDKDSEGLLLLTNDGDLANKLTHPRYNQHKTYQVTVSGNVSDATLSALNKPMIIDDYKIRAATVYISEQRSRSGKTVLTFELKEGRNRQIRKMCEAVDLEIHRLTRTKVHSLTLGDLHPGEWRDLTEDELRNLTNLGQETKSIV